MSGSEFWGISMFIVGSVIGSFAAATASRVTLGVPVFAGRSHCDGCHRTLSAWDLIPIASWIYLGGQCRFCKQTIGTLVPVAELCTGALFSALVWTIPGWPQRVSWMLFFSFLVFVTATDWLSMRIPNLISLPGGILCCIVAGLTGVRPWPGVLIGSAVAVLMMLTLHLLSRGNMGMGDVKLFLSVGGMLGAVGGVEALVAASLSGAVAGVALRLLRLLKRREPIPFVPHILVGVVLTHFFSVQFSTWYGQFLVTKVWS